MSGSRRVRLSALAVALAAGIIGWAPVTAASAATAGTAAIRPAALASPTWSVTSTTLGVTGVTYTFTFSTTVAIELIGSVTLTVPAGTAGTPTLGAATSPTGLLGSSVTLASNTLTISGISLSLGAQAFSIVVNGLTNTTTAGTYTSLMSTVGVGGDSGTSNALTFGIPTLTAPSVLAWSGTLTGNNQSIVDTTSAQQQLTAADVESIGVGWDITVAATTFAGTAGSLPNLGTFVINGSLTSVTATGQPTATCVTTCTLPADGTTYPVAITTAASAPAPVRIYSAAPATGVGAVTLGGHGAAAPIGWWINVLGSARAGAYASTVTLAIASGP